MEYFMTPCKLKDILYYVECIVVVLRSFTLILLMNLIGCDLTSPSLTFCCLILYERYSNVVTIIKRRCLRKKDQNW